MATKQAQSFIAEAMAELGQPQQSTPEAGAPEPEGRDDVAHASDSVDDDWDTDGQTDSVEETQTDPESTDPAATTAPSASTAPTGKETIVVTGDDGIKRRVEIDYSDRASIKKAFEMMHGARKWQAEKDRAIQSQKSIAEKYEKDRRVLDALEQAYEKDGELGVLDLLAGRQGASQEFIQRHIDRARFLENASPQEKAALEQKERLERLERELGRTREEKAAWEKKMAEEREASQLAELQSRINPVFEKYRFDGKLGDEADEALFDETLWNTAMARLKPYEEQGVEITRELVEQSFRETAGRLRKRLGVTADKKAAAVVNKKKQEATEAAQAATTTAYARGGARSEAESLISKGDFRSLFSNFGKYRGALSKK